MWECPHVKYGLIGPRPHQGARRSAEMALLIVHDIGSTTRGPAPVGRPVRA